jgi:hypothetical protein
MLSSNPDGVGTSILMKLTKKYNNIVKFINYLKSAIISVICTFSVIFASTVYRMFWVCTVPVCCVVPRIKFHYILNF